MNQHYDIIQSTNPDFNKAIIRVNIFKNHRQIIQYIQPQDYNKISNVNPLFKFFLIYDFYVIGRFINY